MCAKRSQPTVGPSFIVEQKAIELLKSLLPDSWLWRPQSPDFFVDYNVEVVEAGELTGLQFALQVKGSQSVKLRKGSIRFRMDRKPLLYYRDNARVPVFVALVDVAQRKAYWLSAQQYLRQNAGAAQLDSKNTLSVTFNVEDCFSDRSRFTEALEAAEHYVRDLYPGTPVAAVEHRQQALQKLDPKIGVSVSVHAGHEVVELHPDAPLSLTFGSREAEAREQFLAMIKHGDVFLADMDLLGPLDSPLMRELMPEGRYKVRFEPESRPGSVQLRWQRSMFLNIDGSWRGGTKITRFVGSLLNSPLSVEITVSRGAAAADDDFTISVFTPLRLEAWEGELVSYLPWFDELRSLAATLASGEEVELAYFIQGVRLGRGQMTATNKHVNQLLHRKLDWLERIRFLANHYRLDVRLPKTADITYQKERELDALWALTRGDSFQDAIPGATFGCIVESGDRLPAHWRSGEPQPHGTMKIIGTAAFDVFGHDIEIPDVENIITDIQLTSFEDTQIAAKKRVSFRGGGTAVWYRRRLKVSPTL